METEREEETESDLARIGVRERKIYPQNTHSTKGQVGEVTFGPTTLTSVTRKSRSKQKCYSGATSTRQKPT